MLPLPLNLLEFSADSKKVLKTGYVIEIVKYYPLVPGLAIQSIHFLKLQSSQKKMMYSLLGTSGGATGWPFSSLVSGEGGLIINKD